MIEFEDGLVIEHGAGDGDQTVGGGAQGAGMAVSTGSKGGILGFADGIALHGDACPVIDGVARAIVSGQATDDDRALARTPGDGGGTAQAAQGVVVSAPQGIEGFCKQRGENDPGEEMMVGETIRSALPSACPSALRAPGQAEGKRQRRCT